MLLKLFILFLLSLNVHAFDHNHTKLNEVLKKFVVRKDKQTFVKYNALKKDDKSFLEYLKELESVKKNEFKNWDSNQRLAFLINSYNAFTIKLIIDKYPVKSIKEVGSFFKNTWKIKFIQLLGEKMHLDNIEHNLIRKNFNEPRIHFAVNCASIGCPSLLEEAFIPTKVDDQLNLAAKNFLNNPNKNYFNSSKKELRYSKIFKWYGDDFKEKYGTFYKFIAPYLTSDSSMQKLISENKIDSDTFDYDWNLNELK